MDTDLVLVIGIAVAALTFPAIVSAFSAGRAPRVATIAAVIGGAMIVTAVSEHPGGYRFQDLPQVVVRVADRYLH
ncbi:MAG: hypothetical protein ACKVPY_11240 [Paracoccaceae bacterium]